MGHHAIMAPLEPADWTAERLLRKALPVRASASCGDVAELFQCDPGLAALAVVGEDGRTAIGLADRNTFLLHFAQRYGRELYTKRPVLHLADRSPLLVPLDTPISALGEQISTHRPDALHRGFVLLSPNGHYAGIGLGIDVMRLTAEQMTLTLERLQNTQRELIQREKMAALGGLVAGVAHEINTPLGVAVTAVSAFAQETARFRQAYRDGTLRRPDLEDYVSSAGEAADFIQGNLSRAADLVQSFKKVAVDQTNDLPRQFDLGDYITEVLRSLQPRLRRSVHTVIPELPRGIVVDSAPGAIAQIITNLVMNALIHAFGDAPGIITISLSQGASPDLLMLTIGDDGRGISASDLPYIFDPFFTTRRDQGGTGLGLHVVYNLVTQRLGGRIDVASTPGQGTRFIITFPLRLPRA